MLAEWLAAAGLAHHLPQFRAHGVDYDDLANITDEELRELRLTIGERKRFRRTLAGSVAAVVSGERRPLTLAFFDLVDSSALCEALEAEDMVELLRRYRAACCTAIDRYGGHVSHLLGDGILAYFCYPLAHENDAERALRAALEITVEVPRLRPPRGEPLAVRCGIATGRVVVTELFSGRAADKHAVTGSTANLAARLQHLAPANGIVVSDATALRVEHLFDLHALGRYRLRGFAEPVAAWRVSGERRQPRSLEDSPAAATIPFVGREAERRTLGRFWQRARLGTGGVVWVHGEPGVGKSRLTGRFVDGARAEAAATVIPLYASEFDAHSPLRPVMTYLRGRLAVAAGGDEASTTAALRRLLPNVGAEALEAVTAFLALDLDPREPGGPAGGAARERRRLALDALTGLVLDRADEAPVLLQVEDAHWLDPTSREWLARIAAAAPARRLAVVVTARLPFTEVLPDLEPAAVDVIELAPLDGGEVHELVRTSFGDEPVPRAIVERIAERSDGLPLFVEELLRPLLKHALPADWGELGVEPARPAAVPATLHEALMARLDRLGDAKELAQVAAVLGRSIHVDTLADVAQLPRERVELRLDTLCAAGVLRARTDETAAEPAVARYTFSHALLRDAAYDSLLREHRQRLHARAAASLIAHYPTFAAERPDVVAWHLTEGGRHADALSYWLAAGRLAAARYSLHEARHVLECGARLAESLPETRETIEARLEFAALLGPVLFALCGPGSEESRTVYENAVALAEKSPESVHDFAVLWGWWRLTRDFRIKGERAKTLYRLARARGEPEMLLQAHHCNWARTFSACDLAACRQHIEAGLALYERPDCDKRPWVFGNHDAKACGLGERALLRWMQGELRAALADEAAALAWAESVGHAGSVTHALDIAVSHRYYRRDIAQTRAFAERIVALAEDRGMPEERARGQMFLGWALARNGDAAGGLRVFELGYRRQRAIGSDEDTPYYICMYAEILNDVGDHARALRELQDMQGEFERLGICNWQPEVWRLTGVTLRRAVPEAFDEACRAFERAARLAARQQVVMLELRNAVSHAHALGPVAGETLLAGIDARRAAIAEPDDSYDVRRVDRCIAKLVERTRPLPPASAVVG